MTLNFWSLHLHLSAGKTDSSAHALCHLTQTLCTLWAAPPSPARLFKSFSYGSITAPEFSIQIGNKWSCCWPENDTVPPGLFRCYVQSNTLRSGDSFWTEELRAFIHRHSFLFYFIACAPLYSVCPVFGEDRRRSQISWNDLTDCSELLCGCWQLNPSDLEEQLGLLTTEPSLLPPFISILHPDLIEWKLPVWHCIFKINK